MNNKNYIQRMSEEFKEINKCIDNYFEKIYYKRLCKNKIKLTFSYPQFTTFSFYLNYLKKIAIVY